MQSLNEEQRQEGLQLSKDKLSMTQNMMKQKANQHCSEREFEVGDWEFLELQPYKYMTC